MITTTVAIVIGMLIALVLLTFGVVVGGILVQMGHDKKRDESDLDSRFDL